MDINALNSNTTGLFLSGLLMDAKEGLDKRNGQSAPVLVLTILRSVKKLKAGVVISEYSSDTLKVKDASTFGIFYANLGSLIYVPVDIFIPKDSSAPIFWMPSGSVPIPLKANSQQSTTTTQPSGAVNSSAPVKAPAGV
jgi:hypothetical protein